MNENIFEEGDIVFVNNYDIGPNFSFVGKVLIFVAAGQVVVSKPNESPVAAALERCRHATEEERKEYFIQCLK